MKRKWIKCLMLTAGLALCIVGVALAVDTANFTWDTQYSSGNWDNASRWVSTNPNYPNGTAHNVTIEGRSSPVRAIHLVNADVGALTLKKKEITFDSKGANGKTIDISGVVTIQAGGNNPVVVILTDDAKLDSSG